MVHFTRCRSSALSSSCARCTPRGVRVTPFGIRGSRDVCSFPRLFAACRALHRLAAPQASAMDPFSSRPYCPPASRQSVQYRPIYCLLVTFSFPSLILSNTITSIIRSFMGRDRVELSTPALSERCSNQLSYHPKRFHCPLAAKGQERRLASGHGPLPRTLVNELPF